MSALKLSLSNSHRLSLLFRRSLCTSPIKPVSYAPKPEPIQPQPGPAESQPDPVQIKPVSYAPKPDPVEPVENNKGADEARVLSKEDIRYVKDGPFISPVSYGAKVAPLPEDRPDNRPDDRPELEMEMKREMERRRRVSRLGFRDFEEEKLPFPKLIKQVEKKKEKVLFDLQEAIRQVKANAKANFKESVEIHVNLAPELRRTDLKVDSIASLPHGTGKAVKIAVFAEGSAAEDARAAGADIVGGLELVDGLKSGKVKVDFDVCVTTQQFVPHLQKLGSVLRSRMPSTKAGTVTDDVAKSVKEAKRVVKINKKDKAAVVHAGIGKVDFTEEALRENVGAFVNALLLAKPVGLKKSSKYAGYVNSVHICSTMGPGYQISMQSLSAAADRYNKMRHG